ncbi:hypothetical protein F5X96DRAFT_642313, partial [Biscogniauxia mediterranea]
MIGAASAPRRRIGPRRGVRGFFRDRDRSPRGVAGGRPPRAWCARMVWRRPRPEIARGEPPRKVVACLVVRPAAAAASPLGLVRVSRVLVLAHFLDMCVAATAIVVAAFVEQAAEGFEEGRLGFVDHQVVFCGAAVVIGHVCCSVAMGYDSFAREKFLLLGCAECWMWESI